VAWPQQFLATKQWELNSHARQNIFSIQEGGLWSKVNSERTQKSPVQVQVQVQVQVILRTTASRSVWHGVGPHSGPTTKFLLLSNIGGLRVLGGPSWREDGSVIYSNNSLSLLGPSPAELMTILCLIWDSPNLEGQVAVIIFPQEQDGPVTPPSTGFPLRRLLRLVELRWKDSNPPPHGYTHLLFKFKLRLIYDRQSVGQSVLVSSSHLELIPTQHLLNVLI
jgi:hypothetical protein